MDHKEENFENILINTFSVANFYDYDNLYFFYNFCKSSLRKEKFLEILINLGFHDFILNLENHPVRIKLMAIKILSEFPLAFLFEQIEVKCLRKLFFNLYKTFICKDISLVILSILMELKTMEIYNDEEEEEEFEYEETLLEYDEEEEIEEYESFIRSMDDNLILFLITSNNE